MFFSETTPGFSDKAEDCPTSKVRSSASPEKPRRRALRKTSKCSSAAKGMQKRYAEKACRKGMQKRHVERACRKGLLQN